MRFVIYIAPTMETHTKLPVDHRDLEPAKRQRADGSALNQTSPDLSAQSGPAPCETPPASSAPHGDEWTPARLWLLIFRVSVPLLRVCLGMLFVWFGMLKLAGRTPVTALIVGTVPWLDAAWFVPALGGLELLLGLALVAGYRLDWVSLALAVHLAGTFMTFVMQPGVIFRQGNPLLLTTEGEFVAKNMVLIAAALVVAAQGHWQRRARKNA